MRKKIWIPLLFLVVIAAGWGIGKYTSPASSTGGGAAAVDQPNLNGAAATEPAGTPPAPSASPSASPSVSQEALSGGPAGEAQLAATKPDSIGVIVNKQYGLPDDYKPADLVYPDVPFTFKEKIEKRMMRKEAAHALEEMFAAAKLDKVYLAGVSAYRSAKTQRSLFNAYAERDGEEKARTYSAVPGYSEHQTGLAIDLSGRDGKCAAESCFAGTKEANWLALHAPEYGFIIRYPEGKAAVTGYMYEPWHVRYVGKEIARYLTEKGITLEEYYNAVPVSK
ncbi:M15 family metallopeptidase [Paenibacillus rhizophilus]|uniref:D-alanyl-D-alanine carboxypeptidase family protein n=1 Tax=Paenibacillus rhizophilus TaxID=1850366 RepID=A0A3N9P270_9BACL|nr:M15 family metallopeptidase [Paenibacillus rhizophilus]RQW10311.1 D-alanyl-D-alanine carboxypeptidase family protein [Paenibacillus rhizophilus]